MHISHKDKYRLFDQILLTSDMVNAVLQSLNSIFLHVLNNQLGNLLITLAVFRYLGKKRKLLVLEASYAASTRRDGKVKVGGFQPFIIARLFH